MGRLAIILPIHLIPEGDVALSLINWTNTLDEESKLIVVIDSFQGNLQIRKWVQRNISSPNKTIIEVNVGNPGETRNAGLKEVDSTEYDWVMFVAYDDILVYEDVKQLINSRNVDTYDLLICEYEVFKHKTGEIEKRKVKLGVASLVLELAFWRIIYKAKIATNTFFPSLSMGEDQVFFSRILSLNPKIAFFPNIIYRYRKGHIYQLTKKKSVRSELNGALNMLLEDLKVTGGRRLLRFLLFIRQVLTYLKKRFSY